MVVIRDFVFLLFVLGGAILGSQVPVFVDAYGQRLGGALDEARGALADFQRAATESGLGFDDYRRRLNTSPDEVSRRTGEAVERRVERVVVLDSLQQAMAEAGPWSRPWVVVRSHDREILERAYQQWRPSLTLDLRWGALGLLLGWLLHAGIAGTARTVERIRQPQWPRRR